MSAYPVSPSVSQLANPHSAFIINHRTTLGHSPNDVGWRGTSHDRICNCLHNAQQVRYEALICNTNIAWGFCSYYCQVLVAASAATVKIIYTFHRTKSKEMYLIGCCVNTSDSMWLLGVWNSICLKHGHWFKSTFTHRSALLNNTNFYTALHC